MKNKSTRHKAKNTFRFQPFSERINNIDIDVIHRIPHKNEFDPEDSAPFFQKALEKWNDLNLTESFENFKRELPLTTTLPLLLQQKERIIQTLIKYLKEKNPLSLEPILELVVAFARDLQQEFYPFYADVLHHMIDLLNTKETDQLEWTFTCLAYIFKFLWRHLVKDIKVVFRNLLPLLEDSRPDYINNFAAESFAFIARKVRDKKAFLRLVLKSLKKNPDGISGCGTLFYEMLHGVQNQFHSCADMVFPLMFEMLGDESSQDLLFEVMTHLVSNMVTEIETKKSTIFWTSAVKSVEMFIDAEKLEGAHKVLKLVNQAVKHKKGKFIQDPVLIARCITQKKVMHEGILVQFSEIGAELLMSPIITLPQEHSSPIIHKMLAVPNTQIWVSFVTKIFSFPAFEVFVLPQVIRECSKLVQEDEGGVAGIGEDFLNVLASLVLYKSPPCRSGQDLKTWHEYPLNFANRLMPDKSISKVFLKEMDMRDVDEVLSNMETILCVLVCLPHLKPLDKTRAVKKVKKLLVLLCAFLKETPVNTSVEQIQTVLIVLNTVVECMIHLTDSATLTELWNVEEMLDVVVPHICKRECVTVLRTLDLYLSAVEESVLCEDVFDKLYESLLEKLSSPFHEVRLLSCHILSLFELKSDAGGFINWSLFSYCLSAELIIPSIMTYREKLQYLNKLEYAAIQDVLAKYPKYNKMPLYFLLGNFYINFQLLWEPVKELIATYALGMPVDEFWKIFLETLHSVTNIIQSENREADLRTPSLSRDFLLCLFVNDDMANDRPDYFNYRVMLWKAMADFDKICEMKNRDISTIFLQFLEEEYYHSNAEMANSWNIKINNTNISEVKSADNSIDVEQVDLDETIEVEEMDVEENNEDSTIANTSATREEKPIHFSKKSVSRTLSAYLTLFSKMRNPQAMYREAELRAAYLNLLTHRNTEIQKAALDCLVAYKYNYLTPYRQNIYGLIEEKSLKNELLTFRIDTESEIIQQEHRNDLMPIVMRVLYSKMTSRSPMKGAVDVRRTLVLRFLARCHENEVLVFLDMAFKVFANYMQEDDFGAIVKNVLDSLDLEHMVPPKRLQSALNLLNIMLVKFGRLMGKKLLRHLLRLLFCISSIMLGALRCQELVHPGHISVLRSVRNSCQVTLAKFFKNFINYEWTPSELDTVFDVFVWPWLEKLPIEGIHSPTPLLKIFIEWSSQSQYFCLLAKHAEGNTNQYPLSGIMHLLLKSQTCPPVTNAIMDLLERLVTMQDFQPEMNSENVKIPKIHVNNLLPLDKDSISKLTLTEKLNYGSCLLLPHIPAILKHLENQLNASKNKGLVKRDLVILSRTTELSWDPETCDILLRLLLPVVENKMNAAEEIISHLIITLTNLFKIVTEPEKHLRALTPLFGKVNTPYPRKLLNELLQAISAHSVKDLQVSAQIVTKLNAFDEKWIEQPDIGTRLDGFKQIHELLEKQQIDVELAAIIIHNCFYFIRTDPDLAMKDSSRYCLKKLAPAVCLQYKDNFKDKKFLLDDTILRLIGTGIKSKIEIVQQESIRLLGEMARECKDLHPVLNDLSIVTNKVDPEVDFFENLIHLQSHRKARALLKYCDAVKTLTKAPIPQTLTHYILPLAAPFICSETYSSKNYMVDAAVQTIGTACRLLPWFQYGTIIRFYLGKLCHETEFHKQLVRIIIVILDAFHFNLSKAEIDTEETMKDSSKPEPKDKADNIENVTLDDSNTLEEANLKEPVDELESTLDKEDESETVCEVTSAPIPAFERESLLNRAAARRMTNTIKFILLPQIHRTMGQLTQSEASHKLNKRLRLTSSEEEELVRVPIAVAAVKLLLRLPPYMLDQNLPGIFMKLTTFLKSRLESTRRSTRITLQTIMASLGPKYLTALLQEMSSVLTKGYQVHVLVFTFHAILVSLKSKFEAGDIDRVLLAVLELCKKDLFGALAEEKETDGITGKVREAKSTKSYDTFNILAQFITEKCLVDLLLPIREMLSSSHSSKVIHKCRECLRYIVQGLVINTYIPVESLLIFMYGISSESIPELIMFETKEPMTEAQKELLARQRPDTFLIPQAPRNRLGSNIIAKKSSQTNAHIFVEFGLQLFYTILKREMLQKGDFRSYLDPVTSILCKCLTAQHQHVKLTTVSLKCFSWTLKMDLPTQVENIASITDAVFKLLHKSAAAGLSKGSNYDLVEAAFKVVVVLVRDVKYHVIDNDQMKMLLLYAEQDMHDYQKQANAFTLLKAVLSRKLIAPEMDDVMLKVANLSITSEYSHVRLQARQVFRKYLLNYPLGKKLHKHIGFYISQLKFDMKTGRESALDMIHSLVLSLPIKTLTGQSAVLFVTLGVQLVNDESPECRKKAAQIIQEMLEKLEKADRNMLYDIVMLWLKDSKVQHRRLAAQLCGMFVTVEKSDFEVQLPDLLPLIVQQFNVSNDEQDNRPGKYVRIKQNNECYSDAINQSDNGFEASQINMKDLRKDHLLIQVIQLILKICTACPNFLTNEDWRENVEMIAENCHSLLTHPHEWVRFGAAQLLGHVFGSQNVDKVAAVVRDRNTECEYLAIYIADRLKSLVLDLCAQLQPYDLNPQFVEQIIKNLVFLGRVLKRVSILGQQEVEEEKGEENDKNKDSDEGEENDKDKDSDEDEENGKDKDTNENSIGEKKLSLLWMLRRMKKMVNIEIVQAYKSTVVRSAVFNWIGAIVLDLGKQGLPHLSYQLLSPLARELVSSDSGQELIQLARRVADLIKKKLGMEVYTRLLSRVQMALNARRADRRKLRAQEVLIYPEKAAKRKIAKHLKKREVKKTKIMNLKQNKFKRKKRTEYDIEDI